jgi:hypothetical protein
VLVYVTAGIGFLVIWFIWFPVVRSRHRIVDYHKYSASLSPELVGQLCSEHDYVHDSALRANANRLLGVAKNWRETRLKMDVALPVLFSAIWLAFVVHEYSAP